MIKKMIIMLAAVLFLMFSLPPLRAQDAIVLDCPVITASPLFDLADFPEGAALVLMERYHFMITQGSAAAVVTTPRGKNLPAQVKETETQYQLFFENKQIIIDRMTAEFLVGLKGASVFFGGGTCTKLGEPKF